MDFKQIKINWKDIILNEWIIERLDNKDQERLNYLQWLFS